MNVHPATAMILAATLLATPVLAGSLVQPAAIGGNPVRCPEAVGDRLASLDTRIGSLDEKLSSLDDIITAQEDARRDALDEAKQKVVAAVRQSQLTQEEIDWAVSEAIHEAEAKATQSARAAEAARAAIEAVKVQMKALELEMKALESDDDESAHG